MPASLENSAVATGKGQFSFQSQRVFKAFLQGEALGRSVLTMDSERGWLRFRSHSGPPGALFRLPGSWFPHPYTGDNDDACLIGQLILMLV